jgi:hypothetical protein
MEVAWQFSNFHACKWAGASALHAISQPTTSPTGVYFKEKPFFINFYLACVTPPLPLLLPCAQACASNAIVSRFLLFIHHYMHIKHCTHHPSMMKHSTKRGTDVPDLPSPRTTSRRRGNLDSSQNQWR